MVLGARGTADGFHEIRDAAVDPRTISNATETVLGGSLSTSFFLFFLSKLASTYIYIFVRVLFFVHLGLIGAFGS